MLQENIKMEKWKKKVHLIWTSLTAFLFYHISVIAGFKSSTQKAEEYLQKVGALQKEGWLIFFPCLYLVCGAWKV